MNQCILGIDLGGKSNGHTAACYNMDNKLHFVRFGSSKNHHAHIVNVVLAQHIDQVFIDAPLSLPGVYKGLHGFNDFHRRSCDKQLAAMSPMFLGGFTASAIELATQLMQHGVEVKEVYPKALAKELQFKTYSRKLKREELLPLAEQALKHVKGFGLQEIPVVMHELDALLAWISGYRYVNSVHTLHGHPEEGLIIV